MKVFWRGQLQNVSSNNIIQKDLRRNVKTKLRSMGGEQDVYLKTIKKNSGAEAKRRQAAFKVWMKVSKSNSDAKHRKEKKTAYW